MRPLLVLTALVLLLAGAAPSGATGGYRKPIATVKIGDPGVIYDGGRYVVLATGNLGTVTTAPTPNGPWQRQAHAVLTGPAPWASHTDKSIWAPSVIKLAANRYEVFYAARRDKKTKRRCIGTGTSTNAGGPFTPDARPISCTGVSAAPDKIPQLSKIDSVIDATPRFLRVQGHRQLFLTYKTQHSLPGKGKRYFTTLRVVRLDPAASPITTIGPSHQLTSRSGTIEENPVLAKRPGGFVLFSSLGGYTLCGYHTIWRFSPDLNHFANAAQHNLFAKAPDTCGNGDADVYHVPGSKSWYVFFSAHYPAQPDQFDMYVGAVAWSGHTPRVTRLLRAA